MGRERALVAEGEPGGVVESSVMSQGGHDSVVHIILSDVDPRRSSAMFQDEVTILTSSKGDKSIQCLTSPVQPSNERFSIRNTKEPNALISAQLDIVSTCTLPRYPSEKHSLERIEVFGMGIPVSSCRRWTLKSRSSGFRELWFGRGRWVWGEGYVGRGFEGGSYLERVIEIRDGLLSSYALTKAKKSVHVSFEDGVWQSDVSAW